MSRNPEGKNMKNSEFLYGESSFDCRERSDRQDLIRNLSLAHEMALCDRVLATSSAAYDANSPLRNSINVQMHQDFWRAFQEELDRVPTKLDTAFVLLGEIRKKLLSVMTPNVKKMKADVNRILDPEDIKAKIENGTFVLEQYAKYLFSVMKRLCAPIRDNDILKLSQVRDPVAMFRGIVEILDLMKLDMINYMLSGIKPYVMANDVDYERTKFAEYISRFCKGLPITRAWLEKYNNPNNDMKKILIDAYMGLLTWPDDSYPETLVLDFPKLAYLKHEYYLVVTLSSIMLIACSLFPIKLDEDQETCKNMKAKIKMLLTEVNDDALLQKSIPHIVEHIQVDADRALKKHGKPTLTQYDLKGLASQLETLVLPNNKIKSIVRLRVDGYLKNTLNGNENIDMPTSLGFVKKELSALGSQFAYLVGHNFSVCSHHYANILES
ncbi:T-complex protein 11 homolog [Cimex lectularius]|uniref:Uncharacterized protein n=1 Tax=Cimex lectularius TaxID=79782 RepID=A0A8I6S9V9_CIMLE|nr:T-complex protein 11 homolog [Cimex lectularius]